MSSSYATKEVMDHHLKALGLEMFCLEAEVPDRVRCADDPEPDWRIIDASSSHLFQGTLDRCSDFLRGVIFGRTGQRTIY